MSSSPPPSSAGDPTGIFTSAAETGDVVIAGRYRLLQQLGEGGFGVVYLAEQREPVQRTVAVKVIKPGMDSAQIIARFEQERQALALMDHPNIAKVLDGGTTDVESGGVSHARSFGAAGGRPFFVMELVRGLPITRYCDEQRLTTSERLELFIPVCHAIQHAHQKGIIHRDLKPSNVLVTLKDDKPVPKVIDFGVAKAVHQRLTERTMFTEIGALIGTPEYMSPEQAGVNPFDIDTRSDIYSLGVLLYELLTGVTPLDRKRLRQAAFDEVLRLIREVEPAKPSTRITAIEELPSVAAQRQVEPRKLRHVLQGDLDWVVMKALEKDRRRRYETANGFALDIQRYLNDEPVLASPPSAAYRMRKFIKRNKGPVIAANLVMLALVAGVFGITAGLIQAKRERDEKERARVEAEESFRQARAAVDDYFTAVSESRLLNVPGMQPLRKELLDKALRYYQGFLERRSEEPAVRAEVAATHYRVGMITQMIGSKAEALASFERSLKLYEQLVRDHPEDRKYQCDMAICCNDMGNLYRSLARPDDALRLHQQALAIRGEVARDLPTAARVQNELAKSYGNVGDILIEAGKSEDALVSYEKARAINEPLARMNAPSLDFPSELGRTHNNASVFRIDLAIDLEMIGYIQSRIGQSDDAIRSRRQAIAELEAALQEDASLLDAQSRLAGGYNGLGYELTQRGEHDEALGYHDKARLIVERLVAENPGVSNFQGQLAGTYNNIARVYNKQGRRREAAELYQEAMTVQQQLVRAHPDVVGYQSTLAYLHRGLGRVHAAEGERAKAIEWFQKAQAIDERYADKYPLVRYDLACDLALCVPLIEAESEREKQAELAIETLKRALADGYKHHILIATDPDLDALRDRPDFRELVGERHAVEAATK
jgi:serine/threonine protein kinase